MYMFICTDENLLTPEYVDTHIPVKKLYVSYIRIGNLLADSQQPKIDVSLHMLLQRVQVTQPRRSMC